VFNFLLISVVKKKDLFNIADKFTFEEEESHVTDWWLFVAQLRQSSCHRECTIPSTDCIWLLCSHSIMAISLAGRYDRPFF